jgi:hypothetical protein
VPNHRSAVDERPPRATLFLHEDVLARTLAYEQDLHQWRIAELEAGRGDPGRPTYEEASGRIHSFGVLTGTSGIRWYTIHTTSLPRRRQF